MGIILVIILSFTLATGYKLWPKILNGEFMASVFACCVFLYYLAIPLESQIVGYSDIVIGPHIVRMNAEMREFLLVSGILALAGFQIGLYISAPRTNHIQLSPPKANQGLPNSLILLAFVCPILLFIFFREQILASGTYLGNVETTYTSPVYSFLIQLTYSVIALTAAVLIFQKRKLTLASVVLSSLCIIWGMYSSDKDPIVLGLIALAPSVLVSSAEKRIVIGLIPLSMVVIGVGSILFSVYRVDIRSPLSSIIRDALEVSRSGIVRHLDPAGPLISIQESLDTDHHMYGMSYVNSLYNWMPKSIWPSRPPDLSEQTAKRMMRNWQAGQGFGYSPVAEGVLNFGRVGAFFQFLLYGLVWGLFIRVASTCDHRYGDRLGISFYWTIGAYLMVVMNRGTFSMLTKTFLHVAIPVIVMYFLIDRLSWRRILFGSSGRVFPTGTEEC